METIEFWGVVVTRSPGISHENAKNIPSTALAHDGGSTEASLPPLTRLFSGHVGGIALLKCTIKNSYD
jgi:hypothetical protein